MKPSNNKMMAKTRMKVLEWSGMAVAAGGVFTLLINAGLTPFLRPDAPFAETAASRVFLVRQSLSALVAILLLLGSVGLFVRQVGRAGRLGAIAFGVAFVGSALLVVHECHQVVVVSGVSRALDLGEGSSLSDVGAMIAITTFTLGWIAFSISMLIAGPYKRPGPILVIVGFLSIPILGVVVSGVWGQILGNIVLGAGWMFLGRELIIVPRPESVPQAPAAAVRRPARRRR